MIQNTRTFATKYGPALFRSFVSSAAKFDAARVVEKVDTPSPKNFAEVSTLMKEKVEQAKQKWEVRLVKDSEIKNVLEESERAQKMLSVY